MMAVVSLLPFLVAGSAAVTLLVAIWSVRWPRVKGVIDVSIFDTEWDVESADSQTTFEKKGKFYLVYSYSVGGITFQGSRIAPLVEFDWRLSSSPELSSASDRAKWYREGATVDVSYCPLIPKWTCLEPGGFGMALLLGITAGILFFII